jgi:hypothetical protein
MINLSKVIAASNLSSLYVWQFAIQMRGLYHPANRALVAKASIDSAISVTLAEICFLTSKESSRPCTITPALRNAVLGQVE